MVGTESGNLADRKKLKRLFESFFHVLKPAGNSRMKRTAGISDCAGLTAINRKCCDSHRFKSLTKGSVRAYVQYEWTMQDKSWRVGACRETCGSNIMGRLTM